MRFKTSSDYLDNNTKDEIKKAIEFLIEGGWKTKDELCERISLDFNVPQGVVIEIFREWEIKKKKSNHN